MAIGWKRVVLEAAGIGLVLGVVLGTVFALLGVPGVISSAVVSGTAGAIISARVTRGIAAGREVTAPR